MRNDEKGFVEIMVALMVMGFFLLLLAFPFMGMKMSNETVSGIAYNTTNDRFISGTTHFSIRAGENTLVTAENQSTYCLPPNSPYKELVNKAAQDKRIKIVVTAKKYFTFKAPWTCHPNVTVTEVR